MGGSTLGSSAGLPWFGLDDLGPCLVRWVPETDALRGEELQHTRCKSLSETPPGPLYLVQHECVHTPTTPPPLNTKLKPISSTVSLNIHFPTPANRFVGRCHSGRDQGTLRTTCFRGSPHLPRCLAPGGSHEEHVQRIKGEICSVSLRQQQGAVWLLRNYQLQSEAMQLPREKDECPQARTTTPPEAPCPRLLALLT